VPRASITTGVRPFLLSRFGGWCYNAVTGARKLRNACAARDVRFTHVIGTGNGEIIRMLAGLMEKRALKAVSIPDGRNVFFVLVNFSGVRSEMKDRNRETRRIILFRF
jgi:hypothetical protein